MALVDRYGQVFKYDVLSVVVCFFVVCRLSVTHVGLLCLNDRSYSYPKKIRPTQLISLHVSVLFAFIF